MYIESSNELIKYLTRKEYAKDNYVLIDDLFIMTLENVKNSEVKVFLYCPQIAISNETKEIINYYSSKFETYEINSKLFNRLANKDNCPGVLLLTKTKEFDLKNLKKDPFILVCDGLEQQGNIGTIFRTAEATSVDLIIFTNLKAKVPSDQLVKASRGMMFYVPYLICENIKDLQEFLNKYKIRSVVCEPEQGIDFKDFNYSGAIALIMGNERFGVDKSWFNEQSEYLKIPMFGKMDSLNVAVATSLIIYEAKYSRK